MHVKEAFALRFPFDGLVVTRSLLKLKKLGVVFLLFNKQSESIFNVARECIA